MFLNPTNNLKEIAMKKLATVLVAVLVAVSTSPVNAGTDTQADNATADHTAPAAAPATQDTSVPKVDAALIFPKAARLQELRARYTTCVEKREAFQEAGDILEGDSIALGVAGMRGGEKVFADCLAEVRDELDSLEKVFRLTLEMADCTEIPDQAVIDAEVAALDSARKAHDEAPPFQKAEAKKALDKAQKLVDRHTTPDAPKTWDCKNRELAHIAAVMDLYATLEGPAKDNAEPFCQSPAKPGKVEDNLLNTSLCFMAFPASVRAYQVMEGAPYGFREVTADTLASASAGQLAMVRTRTGDLVKGTVESVTDDKVLVRDSVGDMHEYPVSGLGTDYRLYVSESVTVTEVAPCSEQPSFLSHFHADVFSAYAVKAPKGHKQVSITGQAIGGTYPVNAYVGPRAGLGVVYVSGASIARRTGSDTPASERIKPFAYAGVEGRYGMMFAIADVIGLPGLGLRAEAGYRFSVGSVEFSPGLAIVSLPDTKVSAGGGRAFDLGNLGADLAVGASLKASWK